MKKKRQLKKEVEKGIVDTHFRLESTLTPNNKRQKINQILKNQITILEVLENLLAE